MTNKQLVELIQSRSDLSDWMEDWLGAHIGHSPSEAQRAIKAAERLADAALAIATTARELKKFDLLDRNLAVVEQAIARVREVLDGLERLAVLSLIGTFTMAGVLLALGKDPEIPAWAAAVVSTVLGFYFGSRSTPGDGA